MEPDKNFIMLAETEELILGHSFEYASLITKATYEKVSLGDFYGEPTCGLISETNDWCVVAGNKLVVWEKSKGIKNGDDDLCWIHDIRQVGPNTIEILTDPWANNSAVWELDILTGMKRKIRDFTDYKSEAYCDQVIW
jgi:hypothetical protein